MSYFVTKKRYLLAFLFIFLDGYQSKFFLSFSRAVCLTGERDLRAPFSYLMALSLIEYKFFTLKYENCLQGC